MTQEMPDSSSMMDGNSENYIEISIPDEKVLRRRIIFNWFLAIPHLIVSVFLIFIALIFWVITLFAVLIAGKIPRFSYNFVLGVSRYTNRVWGFVVYFFRRYPKFSFKLDGAADTSDYPIKTHFSEHPAKVPRSNFFRFILVIPHLILSAFFISSAQSSLVGAAALYALVTGRYPDPVRSILETLGTYDQRIRMYMFTLSNKYPRLG